MDKVQGGLGTEWRNNQVEDAAAVREDHSLYQNWLCDIGRAWAGVICINDVFLGFYEALNIKKYNRLWSCYLFDTILLIVIRSNASNYLFFIAFLWI
jgi:hypothetical protein